MCFANVETPFVAQELRESSTIELVTFNCPNNYYNDLASLMLSPSEVRPPFNTILSGCLVLPCTD